LGLLGLASQRRKRRKEKLRFIPNFSKREREREWIMVGRW
jgi:hypothetical protein